MRMRNNGILAAGWRKTFADWLPRILTAEFDILCDEGEAYAKILTAAGVPTEHTRYNGMIHGFAPRLKLFDSARTAVTQVATALKRAFEQAG